MNQPAFVPLPEQPSSSERESGQNRLPLSQSSDDRGLDLERVTRSISAVGATTYYWNIETDEIVWNGNTNQVFTNVEPAKFATGRAYASLLDPDNFTSRFETVMRNSHNDDGNGVPFSIEYSIKPFGRDEEHSIWLEDSGRWFAGPDGRPREVYGIVRHSDERHKQDQHLQFLGNCDPLTGMMNRGRLGEALGETIELAKAQGHSSAFLIVSISNLAIVNDAYGFDVADDVIAKIGRRLREVVRTGDVIGRCSGSKFGIIMSRATEEEFKVAAERFLTIARQRVIETEMGPVWAMLSIGGVILPNDDEDAQLTMAHAEEALTEASKLPTDGVVVYRPSVDLVSERNLNSRCAVEIVHSLKENNFTLAYQPVVNANNKEVAFHEALLRMKCDNGDVVAAGHLIPISEKLGLVRLIDQLVVNRVMAALRHFPDARIALNISGVTVNDQRWFGKLTEVLAENKDVTDRLTVEITETIALEDIEQTVRFIEKLHALGCKVAIDDFGAGFTSFKNLRLLNVDKVKIDGLFCKNLSENKENQFFVRTLIDLSKKFNLEIVAEWVENEEDAKLLTEWGVNYLQGRLFGMAESRSPWGEPIDEADEVCVVPSEILFNETENVSQQHTREQDPSATCKAHDRKKEQDDSQPLHTLNSEEPEKQPEIGLDEEQQNIELEIPAPISTPFKAIIPETASETALHIPDLNLEADQSQMPTIRPEQEGFVTAEAAMEGPGPVVTENDLSDGQDEENPASPLEAEMEKLRQAIEQLEHRTPE